MEEGEPTTHGMRISGRELRNFCCFKGVKGRDDTGNGEDDVLALKCSEKVSASA